MVAGEKKVVNEKYSRIWQTVQIIPIGQVATYGQIADLSGLPGRARMVGKALGMVPDTGWNRHPVPWYRVINSQGKISFAPNNDRFERQKNLLQQEQVVVLGARVKLAEFQWQPDLAELLFRLQY